MQEQEPKLPADFWDSLTDGVSIESVLPSKSYNEVRGKIKTGDVLLFRSRDWYTGLFLVSGRSEYCHAAMAGWWGNRLMCVEMTFDGGRAQLLSNVVNQYPGTCDVYKANASRRKFNREAALHAMLEITGRPYGYWTLFKASWVHLPIIRWFVRADVDDKESTAMPFCSAAVSAACRAGGVDPVPNLADRATEPGDLARSAFFKGMFTLVP